ncbi:MAG TPA: hypothetical protein G4N95_09640 [Anaerolineae bacterium]|nr:hypothetical protein [Anaerolineae bacterium]
MLAQIKHILPKTLIQRERTLPATGDVVVRQGQYVEPLDIIAETDMKQEHLLIDVARGLGLSPTQADQMIQREVGEEIIEGDIIAGPVGIARRVVRSPVTGKIVLLGEGQILLELDSPIYELHAGLSGKVTSLIPGRGAVIETTGALIQGVWGNDRIDFGLLQSKIKSTTDKLILDHIDVSLRGSIIVGGYCDDPTILKKGADIPLRGLILASMSSRLIPIAKKVRYPIIVLEGFGALPMNDINLNILTQNVGREVSINAESPERINGKFPEIVIPLSEMGDEEPPITDLEYQPGQVVLIVREPAARQIAKIKTVYPEPRPLASGITAPAADVMLSYDTVIRVPLVNLEVIA